MVQELLEVNSDSKKGCGESIKMLIRKGCHIHAMALVKSLSGYEGWIVYEQDEELANEELAMGMTE